MELEIWFKKEDSYLYTKLEVPAGSGKIFFERMRLRLVEEIELVRKDITDIMSKYPETSFSRPRVEDNSDQQKLNKLVSIRKLNIATKEELDNILRDNECIVCEHCKSLMYRTPIGVPYTKVGHGFLIHAQGMGKIEYNYLCSNPECHYLVDEDCYLWLLMNRKRREDLLVEGVTWVPDDFNYWYEYKSQQQLKGGKRNNGI